MTKVTYHLDEFHCKDVRFFFENFLSFRAFINEGNSFFLIIFKSYQIDHLMNYDDESFDYTLFDDLLVQFIRA